MAPPNVDFLVKTASTSSQTRPRTNEKPEKYLARLTHLHLNGKGLTSSALPAGACPALKTLYLFDNQITSIEGLGSCSQLRHCYLQNNNISSIGDIGGLTQLTKLYLNHNALPSLEALAPLVGLVELHVNAQKLAPGRALDVAPHVLANMRGLRVLALAANGLTSTDGLGGCKGLETLDLAKNELNSLAAVSAVLNASPMKELDLRGNAISDSRQHLDAIIVSSPALTHLNGRELTKSERPYLQSLHRLGKRRIDLE